MGEPLATAAGIAAPFVLPDPYDDPAAIRTLVRERGPHPLMWTAGGYSIMSPGAVDPWFRAHWALDGRAIEGVGGAEDPAIRALVHHEPFIAASRRLFGAQVVRPSTLLLNLMGPMAAGVPHVDTPEFRGLRRSEVPIWLLVTMGASGLFDRWQLRVAGALTWFYDGPGGEYEYWPDGRDRASRTVGPPFGDVALIGDNNRMYHRVGAIGDAAAFAARGRVDPGSAIAWRGDRWTIHNHASADVDLADDEVRISILWKAVVFADDREAAVFDDHADDLDPATVVDVFRRDLARRGIEAALPDDPYGDPAWIATLSAAYPLG
jgi:hypothetical protein